MASITITTTAAQDARLSRALGSFLGLGRNASVEEIKAYLAAQLRAVVHNHEHEQAIRAINNAPFDPS